MSMLELQEELQNFLDETLENLKLPRKITLTKVPSPEKGHFAFVVNALLKKGQNPEKLANTIQDLLKPTDIIEKIVREDLPRGKMTLIYFNIFLHQEIITSSRQATIKAILSDTLSETYPFTKTLVELKAVVEHTSSNPNAPIHIGNLRGSLHGDSFARILKTLGAEVNRVFLCNDLGIQIAYTAIGYRILRQKSILPDIKIDMWLGELYAIMNCLVNIQKIKQNMTASGLSVLSEFEVEDSEIEILSAHIGPDLNRLKKEKEKAEEGLKTLEAKKKAASKTEKKTISKEVRDFKQTISSIIEQTRAKNDDLFALKRNKQVRTSLLSRFSELFEILENEVKGMDLVAEASIINQAYEENTDPEISQLMREMTGWCIMGVRRSLKEYDIHIDDVDLESDLAWKKDAQKILQKLIKGRDGKSLIVSLEDGEAKQFVYPDEKIAEMAKALKSQDLKDLQYQKNVPPLTVTRRDGTMLYPMKDVAYSIMKFNKYQVDRVYNVIAIEQNLAQFHLLLPLHELGLSDFADNLIHYGYEMVGLKGRRMSGREALYITADGMLQEAIVRASLSREEAIKKSQAAKTVKVSSEEERSIAKAVGLGAIKFAILAPSPKKRIVVDLAKALDLTQSSGPFVQYAYARCCAILRRAGDLVDQIPDEIDALQTMLAKLEPSHKIFESLQLSP